ncbi:MAG: TIGR04283 family arsenosugar biosynthesis glycosyltransferase [Pseudomonadota bacterium]
MPRLSIVVPTLMESSTIADCLEPLQGARASGCELVVVDGGSSDDTVAQADRLADVVLSSASGRAQQMNAGWRAATGARVAFLHADTRMDERHVDALLAVEAGAWGRFDVRLSSDRPAFRVIEQAINIRSRLTRLATGDQVLFADRELLEATGGFPEIPLMEDLSFCRTLRRLKRPRFLRPPVVTSSRRWERNGVLRTILLMWRLRLAWSLGADPAGLADRYRHAR